MLALIISCRVSREMLITNSIKSEMKGVSSITRSYKKTRVSKLVQLGIEMTTHVNSVTALLGTVRMRFMDNPLYIAVHPSFLIIFVVVYIIPPRG
jgi:hypothetical protein